MPERATLTTTVTVSAIVPGDPPSLAFSTRLPGADGREKVLSQQVPVRDSTLFGRLQDEVQPGDAVEVTLVTEWDDEHYTTCLADFSAAEGIALQQRSRIDFPPDMGEPSHRSSRRNR